LAILYLSKEKPVLTAAVFALFVGKVWCEAGKPLLGAGYDVGRLKGISQFLETFRLPA
jgi:hypothetical protein